MDQLCATPQTQNINIEKEEERSDGHATRLRGCKMTSNIFIAKQSNWYEVENQE